jgi:hypothetical protein
VTIDPSSWGGAILANIAAALIFTIGGWAMNNMRTRLERSHPLLRRFILLSIASAAVCANILYYVYINFAYILFLFLTSGIIGFVVWRELDQFWQMGLVGADHRIEKGLDYKRSLALCSNSLDFLGVGASKLTRESEEFEGAINRCHRPNRPIRFLLCDPDNEELIKMAKQAGRDPNEYQTTVRNSLRTLAVFRLNREKNIEVRFYSELPLFRLMFIDDSLCLASHYVFGEGDGSQLPQLHVRRTIGYRRDNEALYYPFKLYFERTWEQAVPWDFRSRISYE